MSLRLCQENTSEEINIRSVPWEKDNTWKPFRSAPFGSTDRFFTKSMKKSHVLTERVKMPPQPANLGDNGRGVCMQT